ncbi:hypothetical protein [Planctomonas psychrotolerans]|uniref:hypothetical protein n=1 Tax=Planctomonas psychrotolerans TaxID=2528712 RepID=UPI001239FD1B|nr:hypothetical protein [Planctomonas psychrotolerans]
MTTNDETSTGTPTADSGETHDDLLHDVIEGAEKLAHEVADNSVDVLETAALIAMEASSTLQDSYKRRPVLMLGVLGGIAAALLVGIAALARRR